MSRNLALAISLTLVLLGILGAEAEARSIETSGTIKAGYWIEYEVTITPTLHGEITPTSVRFEFLSVEGTNVTVQATMRLSDGTKKIEMMTVDIMSGSGTGLFIPPNSKPGDDIFISDQGNLTLEGETIVTHTGVDRPAVYTSSSNSGNYFVCYWDKQTGIMLEQRNTINDSTTIYEAENTNMWQTESHERPFDPTVFYGIVIVVAIVVAVIFLRMRKEKPRRRARPP